jgi:hypothetical protein
LGAVAALKSKAPSADAHRDTGGIGDQHTAYMLVRAALNEIVR